MLDKLYYFIIHLSKIIYTMSKAESRKLKRHSNIKNRYMQLVYSEGMKSSQAITQLEDEFGYCSTVIYRIVKPRSIKAQVKKIKLRSITSKKAA